MRTVHAIYTIILKKHLGFFLQTFMKVVSFFVFEVHEKIQFEVSFRYD